MSELKHSLAGRRGRITVTRSCCAWILQPWFHASAAHEAPIEANLAGTAGFLIRMLSFSVKPNPET
jgi:hypothetical protein